MNARDKGIVAGHPIDGHDDSLERPKDLVSLAKDSLILDDFCGSSLCDL